VILGTTKLTLANNFKFETLNKEESDNATIQEAFERYQKLIFQTSPANFKESDTITSCSVSVENPGEDVELVDADEYYSIQVD